MENCLGKAFVVCEDYSPPEGFNPKDLYRLLEKVGSPCGSDDLGKQPPFDLFLMSHYFRTSSSYRPLTQWR
ncbi:hypothetical protein KSP40_PGU013812 [Platanthera guangdongensis]|uniref:Uncharacterized protein n=1 Tax=Platanthera guangdongensis TaxID=2320717 RepID=A0ABR2MN42_9ASPA